MQNTQNTTKPKQNFRKLRKNHSLLIVLFFLFFFFVCVVALRQKSSLPFINELGFLLLRHSIDLHIPLLGFQAVERTEVGHFDHLYCIIKLYIFKNRCPSLLYHTKTLLLISDFMASRSQLLKFLAQADKFSGLTVLRDLSFLQLNS